MTTLPSLPARHADRLLAGLLQPLRRLAHAPGSNALAAATASTASPRGLGVDEACLWGDFFFLEALARRARHWTPFWHPVSGTPKRHPVN